jgi:hypothetical protein
MVSKVVGGLLAKTPMDGAQTSHYLATDPNAIPAQYYADCKPLESSPVTYSEESAEELWNESCRLLKIDP